MTLKQNSLHAWSVWHYTVGERFRVYKLESSTSIDGQTLFNIAGKKEPKDGYTLLGHFSKPSPIAHEIDSQTNKEKWRRKSFEIDQAKVDALKETNPQLGELIEKYFEQRDAKVATTKTEIRKIEIETLIAKLPDEPYEALSGDSLISIIKKLVGKNLDQAAERNWDQVIQQVMRVMRIDSTSNVPRDADGGITTYILQNPKKLMHGDKITFKKDGAVRPATSTPASQPEAKPAAKPKAAPVEPAKPIAESKSAPKAIELTPAAVITVSPAPATPQVATAFDLQNALKEFTPAQPAQPQNKSEKPSKPAVLEAYQKVTAQAAERAVAGTMARKAAKDWQNATKTIKPAVTPTGGARLTAADIVVADAEEAAEQARVAALEQAQLAKANTAYKQAHKDFMETRREAAGLPIDLKAFDSERAALQAGNDPESSAFAATKLKELTSKLSTVIAGEKTRQGILDTDKAHEVKAAGQTKPAEKLAATSTPEKPLSQTTTPNQKEDSEKNLEQKKLIEELRELMIKHNADMKKYKDNSYAADVGQIGKKMTKLGMSYEEISKAIQQDILILEYIPTKSGTKMAKALVDKFKTNIAADNNPAGLDLSDLTVTLGKDQIDFKIDRDGIFNGKWLASITRDEVPSFFRALDALSDGALTQEKLDALVKKILGSPDMKKSFDDMVGQRKADIESKKAWSKNKAAETLVAATPTGEAKTDPWQADQAAAEIARERESKRLDVLRSIAQIFCNKILSNFSVATKIRYDLENLNLSNFKITFGTNKIELMLDEKHKISLTREKSPDLFAQINKMPDGLTEAELRPQFEHFLLSMGVQKNVDGSLSKDLEQQKLIKDLREIKIKHKADMKENKDNSHAYDIGQISKKMTKLGMSYEKISKIIQQEISGERIPVPFDGEGKVKVAPEEVDSLLLRRTEALDKIFADFGEKFADKLRYDFANYIADNSDPAGLDLGDFEVELAKDSIHLRINKDSLTSGKWRNDISRSEMPNFFAALDALPSGDLTKAEIKTLVSKILESPDLKSQINDLVDARKLNIEQKTKEQRSASPMVLGQQSVPSSTREEDPSRPDWSIGEREENPSRPDWSIGELIDFVIIKRIKRTFFPSTSESESSQPSTSSAADTKKKPANLLNLLNHSDHELNNYKKNPQAENFINKNEQP